MIAKPDYKNSSGPNLSEYHATFQNVSDQFGARFLAAYHAIFQILTFLPQIPSVQLIFKPY
jgi:hypothetical protein